MLSHDVRQRSSAAQFAFRQACGFALCRAHATGFTGCEQRGRVPQAGPRAQAALRAAKASLPSGFARIAQAEGSSHPPIAGSNQFWIDFSNSNSSPEITDNLSQRMFRWL
jgi:hypothetical protein